MDVIKAKEFLERSFLGILLTDPDITDISYNGEFIYYMSSSTGRNKSEIIVTPLMVKDFVRQIANVLEKQFSYQVPILDVSFDKYRFNAVHQSIARNNGKEIITFSLRIASSELKIKDNSTFCNSVLTNFFKEILNHNMSIIISGSTGSGKTEFQKYLISKLPRNKRVIVIDNVLELDQVRTYTDLDINTWQADDKNIEQSIKDLVRNALRSNPDWLIVAESRGGEMNEIINSALTGHPIITTMHCTNIELIPERISRMIMMNEKKMNYEDVLKDVYANFQIFVHLTKKESKGSIIRIIDSISYSNGKKLCPVFLDGQYYKFDSEFAKNFKNQCNNQIFLTNFMEDNNE